MPVRGDNILPVSLFLLMVLMTGCQSTLLPASMDGPNFKVMTYNLYRHQPDPTEGEQVVRKENPDLLFLQEVTEEWKPTLERLQDTYSSVYCRMNERGIGNAVLSRWPISQAQYKPAVSDWHGGWQVRVESPLGPIQVVGVHLMPPLNDKNQFTLSALLETGPVHRREIQYLLEGINPELPLIVLGDFNEDTNGAAAIWLASNGLRDALSQYDLFSPSWKLPNAQWINARIDHVFHSPELYCVDAEVIPDKFSDHEPVLAVFKNMNETRGPEIGPVKTTLASLK